MSFTAIVKCSRLVGRQKSACFPPSLTDDKIIVAALISYFYRINNYSDDNCIIFTPNYVSAIGLLKAKTTLNLAKLGLSARMTFAELLQSIEDKLAQHDCSAELLNENEVRVNSPGELAPFSIIIDAAKKLPTRKIYQAPFAFSFNLLENTLALFINSKRNNTVYRFPSAARIISHLRVLLKAVVNNPQTPLSELPLLATAEYRQLTQVWNKKNRAAYHRTKTIPELFAAQVRANPEAIAISYQGQKIAYQALDRMSTQLAHLLKASGLIAGTPVAIYLTREPNFIIAMLAIIKLGGYYIPLDLAAPKARLTYIIEDSHIAWIITAKKQHKQLLSLKIKHKISFIYVDKLNFAEEPAPAFVPLPRLHKNPTAYVMYTSGSTGHPKGVEISCGNIIHLVTSSHFISLAARHNIAQMASMAFDVATFEVWGTLLNGATLCMLPDAVILDLAQLDKNLRQEKITIMTVTTAYLNTIVRYRPAIVDTLDYLLFGGEIANPTVIKSLLARKKRKCLTRLKLFNVYGPTENTTISSLHLIDSSSPYTQAIPIGKPLANTQVYVLDSLQQVLPIGVIGEMYLGGNGLAKGYVNLATLTSQKFVKLPFADSTLYRTGDAACWLPDGNLDYQCRLNEQIKFSGFNIEPFEIEKCLMEYPTIEQAIIVNYKNDAGIEHLTAYLLAKPAQQKLVVKRIRAFLTHKLPHYMLPTMWIQVKHFPLTTNGKINKQQLLPTLGVNLLDSEPGLAATPTLNLAQEVITILGQLLGLTQLDKEKNFFELGATSLMLQHASYLLTKRLTIKVTPLMFFSYPTIRLLFEFLQQKYASKFVKKNRLSEQLN